MITKIAEFIILSALALAGGYFVACLIATGANLPV